MNPIMQMLTGNNPATGIMIQAFGSMMRGRVRTLTLSVSNMKQMPWQNL